MGCVSYVAIKGGGVEVGEGQGRVQFVEERAGRVSGLVMVSRKCSWAR